MKCVSFKITDSEHRRLVYYMRTPEGGQTVISTFVRDAIREKCDRIRHLRAGDLVVAPSSWPNPNRYQLSEAEKAGLIGALKEVDSRLSQIEPGVIDLSEVIQHYHSHFYRLTAEQRRAFDENFAADLELEAEIRSAQPPDTCTAEEQMEATP